MSTRFAAEPAISVGLLENVPNVAIQLSGEFVLADGTRLPEGEYHVSRDGGDVVVTGPVSNRYSEWSIRPVDLETARFSFETLIGIDFHWEQKERQTFAGALRIIAHGDKALTIINDVPLETYLSSVICSEMAPTSAPDLSRAHAVISRSWLLAQIERRGHAPPSVPPGKPELGREWIRWYDRESHSEFDVCADDHCQRYQGVGRMSLNPRVLEAIGDTRGLCLTYGGHVCDARYSKACGGVVEDFRAAWGNEDMPYLVPLRDDTGGEMPSPPLTDEGAMRKWIEQPPAAWCNCTDNALLDTFLNNYDRSTHDFYRWTVQLTGTEAAELIRQKIGVDLGVVSDIIPLERGLSGRIVRLRLKGEKGEIVIGKELEIRRALSPKHLYSSGFVVDRSEEGEFVLRGAGWGHGVGLCQIGAAVMAAKGNAYDVILEHYYPKTKLEQLYQ